MMAFVLKDRVRETTTTTGTGTLTLGGAVTGYQSFSSAVGNGNTTYYAVSSSSGSEWEVGVGTVGSGTLARTTILASSNSGSAVDFSAGTKDVFVTYAASKAVTTDDIGVTIQAYDADLTSWAAIAPSAKQDTLVSGTNIKTINSTSLLGSGDITTGDVTLNGSQTLTNKTISGANNTLSNIGNSSLTNSSVTVNGTSISLGGSGTVTASTTNALTIGTGLSGTSFNGSSAVTIAIDSTVATLTGTQTLTNKTLTNPTVTNYVETLYAPSAGTSFTIDLANGTVQKFTSNGNLTLTLPSSVSGKSYIIIVAYGGAHTLTWAGGSTIKWAGGTAPTATSTNGKFDIFSFFCDGTNTYGQSYGLNY